MYQIVNITKPFVGQSLETLKEDNMAKYLNHAGELGLLNS